MRASGGPGCAKCRQRSGAATGRAGRGHRWAPLALLGLLLPTASLRAEAVPLPSSLFGAVTLDGLPAPAGTEVSAWLAGAALVSTTTFAGEGEARFRLDLPGDRPETPEREGAVAGESVELRLGATAVATVLWSPGDYRRLNLAGAAGPDLVVAISDGVETAGVGDTLAYSVSVRNDGLGTSRGIVLTVDLPASLSLRTASNGGAATEGGVEWPPFDLAEDAVTLRRLSVAVEPTFPAGLETVEVVAQARDDASAGLDPSLANNRASDVDALAAAPDLALAVSDGRESVHPGETLTYLSTLTNRGGQEATGVRLSLRLPAGVEWLSASQGGAVDGDAIVWPEFALAAGTGVERAVTVRVPADLDPAVTTLEASGEAADDGANGPEADLADNLAIDLDTVAHGADLMVTRVDVSGVATDSQTLTLTGEVEVMLANDGMLFPGSFSLAVFSDEDLDGRYTAGIDGLLGETRIGDIAPGQVEPVRLAVAGTARFRGDRIFAMADAEEEVAELDETNNVADSSASCDAVPTGAFAPVVERRWPPAGGPSAFTRAIDSLSTPLVVQLTDDNGDGRWDERDVPDLVFVTADLVYPLEPMQALRAVRGDTLAPIFDVNALYPQPILPLALSLSGLAAADIDHDGKPEIVSTTFIASNRLIAFEHTGATKWQSQAYRTHPDPTRTTRSDNPTIADLDGDGEAEIVVGANVFDRFGKLRWRGTGGHAFQSAGNADDHRSGAISAVADVDLDGRLEVVTGNTLYRWDGAIVWQVALPDGFPAVGNFDADPEPEIVVVARGTVRLHDADGGLIWGPHPLPGSSPEAGGAPTVGDFDGDGRPEIGIAGSDVYAVYETDGTLRWQASTQDYTSNFTGSTLYDFDGDGRVEVVYRDERHLWIFRGTNGAVLFRLAVSSDTWTEMPVVADVDGDGAAEIVVSSDRALSVAIPSGERTAGLVVVGDSGDGWVAARGLWNQHAYAPELVDDDAGVPLQPAWGWLDHNSFRANVPPAGGAFGSADLTASRLGFDLSGLPQVEITARIGNGGRAPAAPGLAVAVYVGDPAAGGTLAGTVATDRRLAPGEFVDLAVDLELPIAGSAELVVVADDDGSGAGRELECDETNNIASAVADLSSLGLWLTLDDGTDGVGAGDELTYRLTVRNAFASAATGVVVSDELPAELRFLAASDGGVEAGGVVTWPAFALGPGELVERSVTVEVDPALPLGITAITNRANVTDDGAAGPDPTPANNSAVDVDAVVTATANAGGPYTGIEGSLIAFDGAESFDRDGALVAFEWDFDGDGQFDDASGATASWTFADEGVFDVRLRVRDDSGETDVDATTATVLNAPPGVTAPASIAGEEGQLVSLAAVAIADLGVLDTLAAAIDWGDGTSETLPLAGGGLDAAHRYVDDGDYAVSLCVDDGDGGEACAALTAAVANAAPLVESAMRFDLLGWSGEELAGASTVTWTISSSGATAVETQNGRPTLLVGDLPAFGRHEFTLRVATPSDDDFIGFALGFEPGDLGNAAADYLLVDWKMADQSGARAGLALSRVAGIPRDTELWQHLDVAANGSANGVVEMARGATLSSRGWRRFTDHHFRVDHTPSRLRVWVDGGIELDVAGNFPPGRLAFYDYSQSNVVFTPLVSELHVAGVEGELAPLSAIFTDSGVADTHEATVDWGDGAVEAAPLSFEEGRGDVATAHRYLDDGSFAVELCVADDDGGEGCAPIPGTIANLPPALAFELVASGYVPDAVSLGSSSFTDAGVLDLHMATIDWGDGTIAPVAVTESGGSGSLAASHLYATPGSFVVELCVDDGDGGVACATRPLAVVEPYLDLAVTKTSNRGEARPGQQVIFTVVAENRGSLPASGVVLVDTLPEHLSFDSASGGGVESAGVVTWSFPSLAAGAATTVTLTTLVSTTAPFGLTVENVATVGDDGASGADTAPASNESRSAVRLSDGVTPIVTLPASLAGVEGKALALAGASWADTTTGEAHTATVDWGDATTSNATLSPASGTSGAIGGAHVYVDDGAYAVEICVRDAAAHVGCATTSATIANSPPDVIDPGAVNLGSWKKEEYPTTSPSAKWIVSADGLSVTQTVNATPSIYLSPLPAFGQDLQGAIRVGGNGDWDDDFIGFVLGFEPGDSTDPDAEFLLLDWKQANQGESRRGLALSRVIGIPSGAELNRHVDLADNGPDNRVEELVRGLTKGNSGWADRREYRMRFAYSATRVQIWVDDVLEFDLAGSFPAGRFGFYNSSQEDVRYRGFIVGLSARFEGESFALAAPFTDLGEADAHRATIDWDDGANEALDAFALAGFGTVEAAHDYLEDGDDLIEVCVEDDDGGSDCGVFPLMVLNVAPTVVAAAETTTSAGVVTALDLATFTDPGRLDSHTATVDWGDGAVEPASVTEDDGAGEVAGAHAYSAAGLYSVTICVLDDDGGEGCDATRIAVGSELPMLAAPKTVTAVDRDGDGRVSAGDDLVYAIEIANLGPTSATGIVFTDPIPAYTTLVAETVTPEALVTALDPLTLELPALAAGESIAVGFAVRIDAALPAGVREISNSGVVASAELPPVATDDPALPGAADPTRIPVFAESRFAFEKRAELFDLDGNGAATAGDEIVWTLALANVGTTEAAGLLVRDPVANDSELVLGSLVTRGLVTREDPVEIVLDRLAVGATEMIELRTRIVEPLPRTTTEVVNQAQLYVGELAEQLSDDPALPDEADPTAVAVAPIPDLAVAPAIVAEGNAGATALRFRLALDVPTAFPVAVSWATADQTALAGEDYVAAAGVAAFAPGTTEAFVDVAVSGDLVVEADETLLLVLSDPSQLRLLTPEAIGTVVNDDRTGFGVSDASAEEGEPLAFLVRLSAPSALGAAVDYATADDSATAADDYVAAIDRLVFAPFETEKSVVVPTLEDGGYEGDESLRLVLSNPAVAELADPEAIGTIRDDDQARLAIDDVEAVEGDSGTSAMRFSVSLLVPLTFDVAVDFATVAESATETGDFEPVSGTLAIPAGELAGTIEVPVVGDLFSEADETLRVELANPIDAILDDVVGIGTIRDDDLCRGPNLLVNGGAELVTWTELFPGWSSPDGSLWQRRTADPAPLAGTACFEAPDLATAELAQTIDLAPLAERIDAGGVELAISGWVRTGAESPSDTADIVVEVYDATGATLLDLWDSGPLATLGEWAPFESVRELPFAARRLRLRLVGLRRSGAELDAAFDALAVEPLGLPTLSVGDATVHENFAPLDARFEARLSCRLEEPVSFGYATADGSATSPADYLATSGAATIAAGELATALPVPVYDDALAEPAERFGLDLVAVDGAEPLDPRGVGTILDGDNCQESQGYWKNHPERWPTRTLVVGNVFYDEAGIAWLLSNELTDPSTRLAKQLTATLLNLLIGSHPWILPTVERAQAFLVTYPLGSDVKGAPLDEAIALEDELKRYNAKCTKQK